MTSEWLPQETTTHQDHVVAHVIGSTVLGFFIFDETLFVLLDIGFIWKIYLDGEMVLLPHPVAVSELETEPELRTQIGNEIDRLLNDGTGGFKHFDLPPALCLIEEVSFYRSGEQLRIVLNGEENSLAIETSMRDGDFQIVEV